jgi:lipid II:glycine glycyltransferase (peptidoglycan interpeptide bridge formation enzyme)
LASTFRAELSAEDGDAYDRFVDEARGGSYAQARAWAEVAASYRRIARRFFLARRDGRVVGAALVLRPGPGPLPVAIIERGPVVDSTDELPEVLRALRRATLARGMVRLQVMPYWSGDDAVTVERLLQDARFRDVQELGGAHARTLRVDLAPKDLFAGKAGESLRRKIRQAEKAGAVARRGTREDAGVLARLYAELMGAQGRSARPRRFFDALAAIDAKRGAIFVAEHEGAPVSALYASRHGSIATFVVGASSSIEKPFSKMVPAMTAAIRWAKEEGCAFFDMGGIPMEGDTDEKRKSIAQFKLDFAKTPVSLVREHARIF